VARVSIVVSQKSLSVLACAAILLGACTNGVLSAPAGPSSFDVDPIHGDDDAGSALHACDDIDVGPTPLQRLTREQYQRSVRDLLGLAEVDVSALAEDEKAGPFASNSSAQPSELVIEQYLTTAEQNAKAAETTLLARIDCDWAASEAACATQFIATFGRRVYRRPLESAELHAYAALHASYADLGRDAALRVVAQTMLGSPHFLYHVELAPPAAGKPTAALDDYELAARLSFFLTGSTPDDALLDAAQNGELRDDADLRGHALRLLNDARASRSFESFHVQWLDLAKLSALDKDPEVYPAFDATLAQAMRDETVRFVEHVMRKDTARLETLLTAPYSLIDGPLFALYGVAEPAAHKVSTPVQLDPTQRAGLLTQAGFLAVHGHVNQSAPVQRGKVILENLLCQSLSSPPPDVNVTPPDPSPDATTRERFEQHRSDPRCSGCHLPIDGIGMGFENYDGIGAFRSREGAREVDAHGALLGTDIDGKFDGAVDLAHRLAGSAAVHDCVATQWLRFALGRLESTRDACTLEALRSDFRASRGDLRQLLVEIAVSPAFRRKAVAP
jgi:hypothetical protein